MPAIYVKPAEGRRIRQPDRQSRAMPDAGAFVERDAYYERLISCGDVVIADPPKKEPTPSKGGQSEQPRTGGASRRSQS